MRSLIRKHYVNYTSECLYLGFNFNLSISLSLIIMIMANLGARTP